MHPFTTIAFVREIADQRVREAHSRHQQTIARQSSAHRPHAHAKQRERARQSILALPDSSIADQQSQRR
jgi:hypothetical protein